MSAVLSFNMFTYSNFHNQKTREIKRPPCRVALGQGDRSGVPRGSRCATPQSSQCPEAGTQRALPPAALRGSVSSVGSLGAEMRSDHLQTPTHTPP